MLNSFLSLLASLFGSKPPAPPPTPPAPLDDQLHEMARRVLVINFDPVVDAQGMRLTQRMNWNKVDDLIPGFIAEMDEVSYGLLKYQVVDRIDVNEFPRKKDGFQYTAESYLTMMQNPASHHEPDGVDYGKIVNDNHLFDRVMRNEIDEVWLFGAPYFGYWESHMAGKGAIYCNSEPLKNSDSCTRRFVIMGFNYERGVAEMIHDIGHRMESIIAFVYNSFDYLQNAYNAVNPNVQPPVSPSLFTNPRNDFEKFILYEKIAPGRAEMGLVHTPPNADKDFDWQNPKTVSSTCDDWLNFPNLQGTRRNLNCNEWNCGGDGHEHNKWWFKHVPHVAGNTNGILNNWWRYTIEVDKPFR